MTTLVSVRVPLKLKKAAQKVAEANGLDLSTCVRMLFTHMEIRGVMPLPTLTVNGFTEEEEEEILRRQREEKGVVIEDIDAFIESCRKKA